MPDYAARLPLLGGALCLDFTNTLEPWGGEQPKEFLADYAGLLAWAVHAGALKAEHAAPLSLLAEIQPAAASAVLDQARTLRRAIYHLFSAATQGHAPRVDEIGLLNKALMQAWSHRQIVHTNERFAWDWQALESNLASMLWPVALSAGELLASPQLDRVKACAGCGWLFLDISRPGTRRWCDMAVCGNRAKVQRHYARTRKSASR
ncbi:MAG: CGNR zinc finger domain-containing protein [Chloroflexota bacterium]